MKIKVKNPERLVTAILTIISVCLLVGSFFCPPMGVIDGSVLAASGIMFAFAALWVAAYTINVKGGTASVKTGQTEVSITTDDDDKE
jgi:hypothetical protein